MFEWSFCDRMCFMIEDVLSWVHFMGAEVSWRRKFHDWGSFMRAKVSWRGKFHERGSFMKWKVSWKGKFLERGSIMKGEVSWKGKFHERGSFLKGEVSWKGKFHERGSFMKGKVSWKGKFHERWSFIRAEVSWGRMFHDGRGFMKGDVSWNVPRQCTFKTKDISFRDMFCQGTVSAIGRFGIKSYHVRPWKSWIDPLDEDEEDRREGKGRRCCLGDRMELIQFHAALYCRFIARMIWRNR